MAERSYGIGSVDRTGLRHLAADAPSAKEDAAERPIAANVTNPTKGGSGRRRGGDDEGITTVDDHPGVTLLDDWRSTASPRAATSVCPTCGGSEGSDPSAMLGLVLVLLANTAVVAALVTAVVLILA